jgi:hypothetical protein
MWEWQARRWLVAGGAVALTLAAIATIWPSEAAAYMGSIVLAASLALAALAALKSRTPYRPFAVGFFVAALLYLRFRDHPALEAMTEAPPLAAWLNHSLTEAAAIAAKKMEALLIALLLGLIAGLLWQFGWRRFVKPDGERAAKAKWHQFSLGSLSAFTLVVAVLCAWIMNDRAREQEKEATIAMLELDLWEVWREDNTQSLFPWLDPLLNRAGGDAKDIKQGWDIPPDDWKRLAQLPNPRSIVLRDVEPREVGLPIKLQTISHMHNLRRLTLEGKQPIHQLHRLAHLLRLEELWLESGESIDLSDVPPLPRLRHIGVSGGYYYHNHEVQHLSPRLQLQGVSSLPSLRSLTIQDMAVTGETIEQLTRVPQAVYMSDVQFDPTAIANLPQVESLRHLASREIDDEQLIVIAQCRNLKHLSVPSSRVTDHGVKHLQGHPELEWLDLSRTAVSDEGLKALTELSGLTTLFVLSTEVTPSGADAFRAKRPDVTLRYSPSVESEK